MEVLRYKESLSGVGMERGSETLSALIDILGVVTLGVLIYMITGILDNNNALIELRLVGSFVSSVAICSKISHWRISNS